MTVRRWAMWIAVPGLAAAWGSALVAPPAQAIPEFFKELESKYVKPKSDKQNDVLLAIAFEQTRCAICHPNDDKHSLTPYGAEIGWLVNKFDKADKKKIRAALEEVGRRASNPKNPKSPTYGQLFQQGRLPPGRAP